MLGTKKATLKHAFLSHNTMPQMFQVLRECAIDMLTAGMSNRAFAREFDVHFSTISCLQRCFREFGSTFNWPHNRRPCVWRHVGERFADANIVNRVPHGGGGVMVSAGINYGKQTQLHFIDGNLNAQRLCDGLLSCHSSTTITSCFINDLYTIPGS